MPELLNSLELLPLWGIKVWQQCEFPLTLCDENQLIRLWVCLLQGQPVSSMSIQVLNLTTLHLTWPRWGFPAKGC